MEKYETNVEKLLAERGRLSETDALLVSLQIGAALDSMHRRGIAHNDMKAADVCIDAATLHVHVCDFGYASGFIVGAEVPPGAPVTRPPEATGDFAIWNREYFDVWALGCIAFQVRYSVARSRVSQYSP